jgi:uncharacterized protein (DUF983 family)
MDDPVSGYCDYLDKEMTIMGLLSAFAVGVPAVVLDRTAGADTSTQAALAAVWSDQRVPLGAGSLAFVLAALFFYRQRSLLAYYVGQLRFSQTDACYKGMTAKGLLEDADSWATWVHYQTAFVLLTLGFIFYGFAFYAPLWLRLSSWRTVVILSVVAALYAVLNAFVMTRYRYHDNPWVDWVHSKKPIKQ